MYLTTLMKKEFIRSYRSLLYPNDLDYLPIFTSVQ